MKLPVNTIIPREKLTQYLLVKRPVGDKSGFLKQAGYTVDNWGQLESDLRQQVLSKDAVSMEQTAYGELFEILAKLNLQVKYFVLILVQQKLITKQET